MKFSQLTHLKQVLIIIYRVRMISYTLCSHKQQAKPFDIYKVKLGDRHYLIIEYRELCMHLKTSSVQEKVLTGIQVLQKQGHLGLGYVLLDTFVATNRVHRIICGK